MPLRVRLDHRLERLADALIDRLATPPASVFAQDVVVVPSLGVGRWLRQRVAHRHGVCARLKVDFAGRHLWQVYRVLLPDLPSRSPFDPLVARWTLLALLESLPDEPQLALLRRFVRDASPADRFALAGEIAQHFDRYLAYRRDWLMQWQRGRAAVEGAVLGPHEQWQRWLWCRLVERLPGVSDRHPVDRVMELLERDPERVQRALAGQRLAILGAVAMSPEQLDMFARLARHMDVSVLAPDPCRELWADLLDSRSIERVRSQRPDVAWLYEGEPVILGNWGRAQRDAVAQICHLEELAGIQIEAPFRDEASEFEAFADGDADDGADGDAHPLSTLRALQAAVFVRSDSPWRAVAPDAPDRTLQVHAVHGTVRQAEVLHDCLLECFADIPGLRADEVAVFCTDVDAAADAIGAAFSCVAPERRIPVAISGRRRRVEPLVEGLLELLSIVGRRAPLSAVAGWLENPAVASGIGLDEEGIGTLVQWLDVAGARRGLDASDGPAKHHWQAAFDRMILGVAVGAEPSLVGDVTPVPPPRGDSDDMLRALLPVVEALRALRDESAGAHPVAHWCGCTRRVLETLFANARRDVDALASVHDALAELQSAAAAESGLCVDLPTFRQALAGQLDEGASSAVASGAVTVCGIGGLRGVPFRVVCLFGMEEVAYPRRTPSAELDLMIRAPRFGDGVSRIDDRGVFLDSLLAAGERAIILYNGRDPRDDTVRSPSVLVTELIDYVRAKRPAGGAPFGPIAHPLHPFAPRAFRGAQASRASHWLQTAAALATPLAERPAACGPVYGAGRDEDASDDQGREDDRREDDGREDDGREDRGREDDGAATLGQPGGRIVLQLREVHEALAEPARAWLRHALGMRLPPAHLALDELEPLWPDSGSDRFLVDRAARKLLDGESRPRLVEVLRHAPDTAAGVAGRVHAEQIVDAAAALVARALEGAGLAGVSSEALDAAAAGRSVRVDAGPCSEAHSDGPGVALVAAIDSRDALPDQAMVTAFPLGVSAVLRAWLAHAVRLHWLIGQGHSQQALEQATTCLAAPDATVTIRGLHAAQGLEDALRWAARIRSELLPLFPRTSFEFHRNGDESKAADVLFGDDAGYVAAELDRPWQAAVHRDAEPDLARVLEAGVRVYGPIFEACAIEKVRRE